MMESARDIFEEALDKYGKEFNEIRKECVSWIYESFFFKKYSGF